MTTTLTQSIALSTLYSTLALLVLALTRLPLSWLLHTILPGTPTSYLAPTLVASIIEPPLLLLGIWHAAQVVVWELDGGEALVAARVGVFAFLVAALAGVGVGALMMLGAEEEVVAAMPTVPTAVWMALVLAFAVMPWVVFISKKAEDVEERLVCVIEKGSLEQEEYCTR